ncbi:MFS transporter [Aquihabitans sp. G128]|uniref:MFS transporter n=1 Tax=Aquihabitans sp. G128 TaxID=2849779 RepID=UPI001C22C74D|nr:MFS transporter [Aquihabitans sp. G128]QXC59599.1 MFS transporter [Aquihabitans sp. G128]
MSWTDRRHSPLAVECATYLAFGMPVAMLGAGWPEARHTFDRPSSALGLVAAVYGLGRLATSATALPLLKRWTIRTATVGLLAALGAACLAVGLGRSFPLLVVAFVVVGGVSGALDSLGNRYQTVVRLVRNAGLMFGAYGVGATLGPALVAVTTWTTGYLVAAAVALAAAALARSHAVAWPDGIESPAAGAATAPAIADDGAVPFAATPTVAPTGTDCEGGDPVDATRATSALVPPGAPVGSAHGTPVPKGPLVLSLACFLVFCALEVTTGNWTTSYLEEHRGASSQLAGLAVSGFWGGVTIGRLVMGRIPAHPHRLLTVGAVTLTAAYLSVPFLPTAGSMVAIVVAGVALAVMLPTLVVTTAERVGVAATGRVTGWQILAANVGGTVFSGGMGFLVSRTNDGAPIWVLIGLALVGLPVLNRALAAHPPDVEPATP